MPGLFSIVLYYLILLTALTGWLFQGNWRVWKISAVALLIGLWCGLWLQNRQTSRLTVLPLNGGHAIFLNSHGTSGDWLIDCGNESAVQNVVKPYLQAQGVNRLSNLLLTHGEIGYTGGAEMISEFFHPRNIYTGAVHFRSPDYRQFQFITENDAARRPPLQPGDHVGPWTIFYPPSQTKLTKAEDNALVLRGEINGARILLLSDLSHAGQNALLATTNDLHADIVIAGLPSDGEPFSEPLLAAIRPQVIVVADSQQPASKRAGTKLKQRLVEINIPVFYTSESDAVTLSIRPEGWKLTAMDGMKFSSPQPPSNRNDQ